MAKVVKTVLAVGMTVLRMEKHGIVHNEITEQLLISYIWFLAQHSS